MKTLTRIKSRILGLMFLLLPASSLNAYEMNKEEFHTGTLPRAHHTPFKIYSSPKTGVNLLFSLLDHLITDTNRYHTHFFPKKGFFTDARSKGAVVFIPIRDVRDQMVSAAHFFHKIGRYPDKMIQELKLPARDQPLSKKQVRKLLFQFIRGKWPRKENWPNDFMWSFRDTAILYLLAPANVHFVRFEHLVGVQGGGNEDLQRQEIYAIAEKLGIELTFDELDFLSSHIFGGSWNFHKGQIGQWKEYFTDKHCREFQKHFGEALLILGYE